MSDLKSEQKNHLKSFTEWCLHKEEFSNKVRNTIDLLLEIAGTYNYEEASQQLASLTKLDLMRYRSNDDRVYDLRPIASLTQLTRLRIHGHITELDSIAALTNLEELGLHGKINNLDFLKNLTNLTHLYLFLAEEFSTDLSPLSELTKLNFLCIELGQVEKLSPLKHLVNLEELKLNSCHVEDLEDLKYLTKLTRLTLEGNQISNIDPLSELNSLEKLNLTENEISDLSPLQYLSNLKILKIGNNQIQNVDRLKSLKELYFLDIDKNEVLDLDTIANSTNLSIKVSEEKAIDANFENWLKMHFDRSEDLHYFIETDDKWSIDLPPKIRVNYVTQLFENAQEYLKPFSDIQVYKGLSDMRLFGRYDLDDGIVWTEMERAINSIFHLFEQCFQERCSPTLSHLSESGANPLNHICYMWWDAYFCCEPPENEIDGMSNEQFIKVMEKILDLDSDACRESALHGLGHAAEYGYADRVAVIIDRFLSNNRQIRSELKNYAIDARVGYIL
jgi:Leucine-rich repeat (LRR) protein